MKKYLISGLMIVSISLLGILLFVSHTQKALADSAGMNGPTLSWDQQSYTSDQSFTATGTVLGGYYEDWCGGELYVSQVYSDIGQLQVEDPEDDTTASVGVSWYSSGSAQTCDGGMIEGDFHPAEGSFSYTADTSNDLDGDYQPLTVSLYSTYPDKIGYGSPASTELYISHSTCQDTTANNYGGSLPCTYNSSTYTVSTGGSGCTASPASQTVNPDHTANVTFTPNDGYTIDANNDFPNDSCGGSFDSSSGTYTTGAISNDCEVDAVCEPQIIGEAPTVTLTANPYSIQTGGNSTLRWSSTKADSCSADWASNTMTNGSETVSPTATKTYTITCTNNASGQTGSASATVTVTNTPPPPPPPPVNGGWGGWGPWSSCSASCGGGTQNESRACDSPTPAYGGSQCTLTDGSHGLSETQTQACNTQPCTPTTNGSCSTTQHFTCAVGNYNNDGVNNTSDWTWSCTGTDNIPVSCTMLKPKPVFKEN